MSAGAETEEAQFTDTPEGWAARFTREFKAARVALKGWHDQAEEAEKAYLDERESSLAGETRWNLFTSDTQMQEAMLFGRIPQASVTRRFADAQDDLARVGGVIQERILNTDIERDDDTFMEALECSLKDRNIVGFGCARVRYVTGEPVAKPGRKAITDETGRELAPAVPEVQTRPDEQVETDFFHWRDVLWGACRVWHEVPWVAFRAQLSRKELARKFGEQVAEEVPLNTKKDAGHKDGKGADPWSRSDVWEVWVKDERQVFFFVEGYGKVLAPVGQQMEANGGLADPLGLRAFWPCPKPMFANLTNSKLVPKPDYWFARDQYREINDLKTRVRMLQEAIRVVGVYDRTNTGLKQMLSHANGNEMIPVDNWALLAEKGGIRGAVDWFPLEQVVNALVALRDYLTEQVDAVRQITGMSDIMRGQAGESGVTASEQRIKARFGSVRMQKRQEEFARFATDLQKLRAEVMSKHFDESTYLARCNCENTPDAEFAQQAVALLKSDFAKYRIEIKPEAISMTDFDALKQERTEVLSAVAQYLSTVGPLAQQMPQATSFFLQILQWMISGLRGASSIEGVLDQAIAQAQQAAQQPQPQAQDPKLEATRLKGQLDLQKVDAELKADIVRAQVDAQAEDQKQQSQMTWNLREQQAGARIKAMTPVAPKAGGPSRG